MHDLKKTVLNKNRVEASICESNILLEITFFCSHYFGSDIDTRLNHQPRNIVDVNGDMDNCLSVFKHRSQPLGGEMRGEQVVISEVMQLPYVTKEECVGEDDDEEEEFDGTETSEEEVSNYLTESDSD
ncbi:hypothetical protein SLA2020_051310 [Shorea laevis]